MAERAAAPPDARSRRGTESESVIDAVDNPTLSNVHPVLVPPGAYMDPTAVVRDIRAAALVRAQRARYAIQHARAATMQRYIDAVEELPREELEAKLRDVERTCCETPAASPRDGSARLPKVLREYLSRYEQLRAEIADAEATAANAETHALRLRSSVVSEAVLGYAPPPLCDAREVGALAVSQSMCLEHVVLQLQTQQAQIDKVALQLQAQQAQMDKLVTMMSTLLSRPTVASLRRSGLNVAQLLEGGFTPSELKAAGFTLREMMDGGVSLLQLRQLAYTAFQLRGADPRLPAETLRGEGFDLVSVATCAIVNAHAICIDTSGDLYVVNGKYCICKIVAATGVMTTLAGNGAEGYADGTGTAAQFSGLTAICVDTSDNIYVADSHRIRKIVAATGVVTTLAGNGKPATIDGTGTTAQFCSPQGICVDTSGNIYVAEYARIRKIIAATGVVTTLAGSGMAGYADGTGIAAQFNSPTGICVDTWGNAFVADAHNRRIRKIVVATGVVTTIAESGTAGYADGTGTVAQFGGMSGICADARGNVYVADPTFHRIHKIVVATGVVTTLAGSGTAGYTDGSGTAHFRTSGIADTGGDIRVISQFNSPQGICAESSGNLYVADSRNATIRKISMIC